MILRACLAALCLALPVAGLAQDDPVPAQQPAPPVVALPAQEVQSDAVTWEQIATRAENVAQTGNASSFAISRLRAELVIWRDRFLADTQQNSGRLATLDAQIAALGTPPETGEEPAVIADRRAALQTQRDALLAPRLLAEESFARANGLISEFDAQSLQREAAALTARGPVPVTPANLALGIAAVWEAARLLVTETAAGVQQQVAAGRLWGNLPRAAALLLAGIGALTLLRWRMIAWRQALALQTGRFVPVWGFGLSLLQMLVSAVALFAVSAGLSTLGVFGLRGGDAVAALPWAGMIIVLVVWLGRHLFPAGEDGGFLGYDAATRAGLRRYAYALAWVLAAVALGDAVMRGVDTSRAARAAITWPVLVVTGLLLWRFGTYLQRPPTGDTAATGAGRKRRTLGRLSTAVAVAAPLIAAIGFGDAGQALALAWVSSLGLLGVVLVLQGLIHAISQPFDTAAPVQGGSLLPVLAHFLLYLASLPFFALIWGARSDDLAEVWSRFREGFLIGDTRISPTDFLTFAAVFGAGYLLTRFVQGVLRKSVLPRTRLDLGGQNAVVAGVSYVGIILAAIVAITSAGIDLSNLAIVAGALSVGIGFGLQNIVSNFVSGIILLIERPVSEGDWIEVGGQMGHVRAISVRSTRIETFDRTDVIIPNADLVSGQVTNWTRGNLVGRVIVPVGVAYGSDVDKVMAILTEIAEAHPMVVITPPPAVLFTGFGADSLDFEIRAILRDVHYVVVVKSEINIEINRRFAAEGIEIPFAQRDIWLRNPEVLREDKS